MKKQLIVCATVMGLALTPIQSGFATGIPVVDVSNLAQNILTALRTLQSNLNEVKMIANQVQSLQNEFKNLTKLDFNIIDGYSENMTKLFEEIGSVHGLMQDLSTLEQRFEELYPEFNELPNAVTPQEMSEVINQALNESREMMRGAARTGAAVLESLPRTHEQLQELLVNSENSVGILQATQSGNQIAAQVAEHVMHLNAQIATLTQAQMAFMQRQNTDDAIKLNRAQHVLDGKKTSSEPPVAMAPF